MLTISSHFPRVILHAMRTQDLTACQSILADLGISQALLHRPRSRIPMDRYIELYRQVSTWLRDESFGFLENPLKPGTFAIACEYAANAPDLGEALERLCRFYHIVTGDLTLALRRDNDGKASFSVVLKNSHNDCFHFMSELFLCIAYRLACWLTDRALPMDRVSLGYPEPPHVVEYAFFFPFPRIFRADGPSRLEFEDRLLNLPVLKSKVDAWSFAARVPADFLSSAVSNNSFSNRVYLILQGHGGNSPPTLSEVARQLTITEQTLRRRLRAEASSFQELKDAVRRDKAVFLLATNDHTIAEIAERLAFSSPAAFTRAFKKWTGLPPKEYRRGLGA